MSTEELNKRIKIIENDTKVLRITQKLACEEVGRTGGRVNEALISSILEKA
jgi:hypothetical protein